MRYQSPLYLACIVAKKGTDPESLKQFGVFRRVYEMSEHDSRSRASSIDELLARQDQSFNSQISGISGHSKLCQKLYPGAKKANDQEESKDHDDIQMQLIKESLFFEQAEDRK